MTLLLPIATFAVVLGAAFALMRRTSGAVAQINRHQIAAAGVGVPVRQERRSLLESQATALGQFATRATRDEIRTKSAKLLLEAGSPMPLGTYLLLRVACTFVLMPAALLYILDNTGITPLGVLLMVMQAFTVPNLPVLYVRRKARKRAKEIEHAMPDAIDLLVVCVEGGLSLDGGLNLVAKRTDGLLAAELTRMQGDVGTGMSRRDALKALAARSQSESLNYFCITMVQAEKLGMSIGVTLRTLADTMRTRRRQAAETAARKAPIKMVPVLVFFMIPSIFIVILAPAALNIYMVFSQQ